MSHQVRAITSAERMRTIRATSVPDDSIALWFLGQNGFLLKSSAGTLVAIDPYLTDSCATLFKDLPLDLSRRLPVLLDPVDLDVDFYVVTHSHEDHLDEATVRGLRCAPHFVAPWEALQRLRGFGLPAEKMQLLHPNEIVKLNEIQLHGTFALPTDATDLNHIGLLFEFANDIRFYNTGDTAYAESLGSLLPRDVDICAICINGGFNNLSHAEAARLACKVKPRVVIPTHWDMMRCNLGDPEMFRVALQQLQCDAKFELLGYDEPFVYTRVTQ